MSLLQYAGRLFSVATLDTRFTVPSKPPLTRIDPARPSPGEVQPKTLGKTKTRRDEIASGASPPRWKSREFVYHGLVFLVVVPLMFKTVFDVSRRKHSMGIGTDIPLSLVTNNLPVASDPQYPKFAPLLSPSWIPGRMVDNSDDQYASFRENVPYLLMVIILHPFLRRLFDAVYTSMTDKLDSESKSTSNGGNSPFGSDYPRAERRLKQRASFDVAFSVLFIIALHGFSAPKILLILYLNYTIATRLQKDYVPTATWIFNIGILFANELGKGYHYSDIARILPWSAVSEAQVQQERSSNWGTVLDSYGGLIPRWEIPFNITVLRLISFNFDYYWSLNQTGSSAIEVCPMQRLCTIPP